MSAVARIRLVLADDHSLFRAGIRALVQTKDDLEIVGEASDGREALDLVTARRPDVVLMDVQMPSLNGLDATARITRAFPETHVVMLSMHADEDSVLRALRAGAVGYVVKSADPAELEVAIRAAARGRKFLSSPVSERVLSACLTRLDTEAGARERLSQRQREVLQLIAEGHTTKEIAATLDISPKTAESYRGELMHTLDIHDVASLTRYAIRTGLISP